MAFLDSYNIRRIILEQSKRAHVGHIGSCLSVADIIAALYSPGGMNIPAHDDPDRDRLVLAKGHAALALYAALHLKGWLSADQLDSFHGDDTPLGVHPEHVLPGVDFTTGSLGHGLSFGVGAALAAKLQNSTRRVFVLLSDAECNEGSVWEAAMFAAQHQLHNLTVILDLNGQQAFGYTSEVLDLSPMADRWGAFGWRTSAVDGHDLTALQAAINSEADTQQPHIILAETTFGKGVSYMEGQIKWHYWPMSDDEYQQALAEIAKIKDTHA